MGSITRTFSVNFVTNPVMKPHTTPEQNHRQKQNLAKFEKKNRFEANPIDNL